MFNLLIFGFFWIFPAANLSPIAQSTAMKSVVLSLLVALVASAKPDCQHYFGSDVTDGLKTVVDVDVFTGYPTGNLTFVHYSGPGSKCASPSPPKGFHRYYKVTYSSECADKIASVKDLAGSIDTNGAFDRASGVLKGCFDYVTSFSQYCYKPRPRTHNHALLWRRYPTWRECA